MGQTRRVPDGCWRSGKLAEGRGAAACGLPRVSLPSDCQVGSQNGGGPKLLQEHLSSKGRGVSELRIRGFQQVAVKAKSGPRMNGLGSTGQGLKRMGNHICHSPSHGLTCGGLQTSKPGTNRKRLEVTRMAANIECHRPGGHP